MDTESGFLYEFTTSDRYIAANRPQLVVEYTLPEEEPDWVNKAYTYEDADHIHAVTSLVVTDENDNQTTNTYRYDANGNMTCRIEGGETFLQAYNAENRMSGVLLVSGDCDTLGDTLKAWQFTYDGDGVKVKQVYTDSNGTLTTYYYAGGAYELQTDGSTETVRQYYGLAGVTAGMREGSTFYYFLTDHLGSVVGVTDSTGALVSETRYLPFGEIRTDVGTISQTDYGYTFQKNVSGMGLMDYKARYYSSLLGRFTQPDTIIPGAGNPQAFNRYSYSNNNPVNYTDPSGYRACDDDYFKGCKVIKPKSGVSKEPTSSNTAAESFIEFPFQMLPVFDEYYYSQSTNYAYSGFQGSGDPDRINKPIWDSNVSIPKATPGSGLGLFNDFLYGFRPLHYKIINPYDQIVKVFYEISYQGVPRIDAQKKVMITDITITNNSTMNQVINYSINIIQGGHQINASGNAIPGQTSSFNIPDFRLTSTGFDFSIVAYTGCTGPCIQDLSLIRYVGSSKNTFK
jgi:RHS repeat-associated protein